MSVLVFSACLQRYLSLEFVQSHYCRYILELEYLSLLFIFVKISSSGLKKMFAADVLFNRP